MAEIFDIANGEVLLKPDSLYIKPFRDLWLRDKSKYKERATSEISYIVFLLHAMSPYMAYPEAVRESIIKEDLFGDIDWDADDLVKEGIEKYKEFQCTTNTRLLEAAKSAAEELSNYFRSVRFDISDERGKPIYSAKELASNLSAVGNIIKSLSLLEKQVRREQIENMIVRGQGEIGDYELPKKSKE